VVERIDRSRMIRFFEDTPLSEGIQTVLGDDAARHARARRITIGEPTEVLDGCGHIGRGDVVGLTASAVTVEIRQVVEVPKPPALDVLVPVADRERMLWAAEKCAELQISVWQPVYFERSRSVNPRGEGDRFRAKVRARMVSALEQSGGAWLPAIRSELDVEEAWQHGNSEAQRLLCDSRGTSLGDHITLQHSVLAVGPEGGFTEAEIASAESSGWKRASLGPSTLRFETAIIAGVAVLRNRTWAN
jgi:16S rRNA (uracil1498-N3)-methyltransferase